MSSLNENTQEIVNSLSSILNECDNIQACIDDIDYGNIKKTLRDVVYDNIDSSSITEVKILLEYINNYKNSGCIESLIKFLVVFNNNPYTNMEFDNKVSKYIYNKLFNIKESV